MKSLVFLVRSLCLVTIHMDSVLGEFLKVFCVHSLIVSMFLSVLDLVGVLFLFSKI